MRATWIIVPLGVRSTLLVSLRVPNTPVPLGTSVLRWQCVAVPALRAERAPQSNVVAGHVVAPAMPKPVWKFSWVVRGARGDPHRRTARTAGTEKVGRHLKRECGRGV